MHKQTNFKLIIEYRSKSEYRKYFSDNILIVFIRQNHSYLFFFHENDNYQFMKNMQLLIEKQSFILKIAKREKDGSNNNEGVS